MSRLTNGLHPRCDFYTVQKKGASSYSAPRKPNASKTPRRSFKVNTKNIRINKVRILDLSRDNIDECPDETTPHKPLKSQFTNDLNSHINTECDTPNDNYNFERPFNTNVHE